MLTYGQVTFDTTDKFGDNGDRVNIYMLSPNYGQTLITRYVPTSARRGTIEGIHIGCGYVGMCVNGAYMGATSGAVIKVNIGSTTKMEHRLQWTGLSGYVGGADDTGSENEMYIHAHNQPVTAGDAITLYVTAALATRPMVYQTNLHGYLSSGAPVHASARTVIQSTTETAITVYTVPAGTTLAMQTLSMSIRLGDGFLGRACLVYGGVPIIPLELSQSDVGGMYGLSIPIMGAEIEQGVSLGFNFDSFNCVDETVNCLIVSREESYQKYPIIGGSHVISKTG